LICQTREKRNQGRTLGQTKMTTCGGRRGMTTADVACYTLRHYLLLFDPFPSVPVSFWHHPSFCHHHRLLPAPSLYTSNLKPLLSLLSPHPFSFSHAISIFRPRPTLHGDRIKNQGASPFVWAQTQLIAFIIITQKINCLLGLSPAVNYDTELEWRSDYSQI